MAEVTGNSSLSAVFVYGADAPAPSYMITSTNTYRILSDERGSVRLVVNAATGSIAQQLSYDEFGRVLSDSNPGFQPFGFAGGQYDPDTSLVRFGARDYSSETGQWTARDPLLFTAGAFNLYSYAAADPVNFIDSLGTGPESHSWAGYFWDQTKALGLHAAHHLSSGIHIVSHGAYVLGAHAYVEAADLSGQFTGVVVNALTGGKLDSANYAAKTAGDLSSGHAKTNPMPNAATFYYNAIVSAFKGK